MTQLCTYNAGTADVAVYEQENPEKEAEAQEEIRKTWMIFSQIAIRLIIL